MAAAVLSATPLVPGEASGAVFVLREPLSFWGGLDAATGRIIDHWHPQNGEAVNGRVLVMESGRGSSSGSSVLAEAIRRGTGPAAIILLTRDAIVTVGALVAAELYGKACPVVMARPEDWPAIAATSFITVAASAAEGKVTLARSGPSVS